MYFLKNKLFNLIITNIIFITSISIIFLITAFVATGLLIKPEYYTFTKMYIPLTIADQSQNSKSSDHSDTDINLSELELINNSIIKTYIEFLDTNFFYESVKKISKTEYSVAQLHEMINFNIIRGNPAFKIEIYASNPNEAKLIADSCATAAIEIIGSTNNSIPIKLLDPALFPNSPLNLNMTINCILGFFLGLIVSIILIILKDILCKRIKNENDLIQNHDKPILACIPKIEPSSNLSINLNESYKILKVNTMFSILKSDCKKL